MTAWENVTDTIDASSWNNTLLTLPDFTIFNTYEWGEYQKSSGWQTIRLTGKDEENNIVSLFQASVKKLPFKSAVVQCHGGIPGSLADTGTELNEALKKILKVKRLFTHVYFLSKKNDGQVLQLASEGYTQSVIRSDSGYSLLLNTEDDEEQLKKKLTRNWRWYIKQFAKKNLRVEKYDDSQLPAVITLYNEMEKIKGLKQTYSKEQFIRIISIMDKYLNIYISYDENDTPLAIHASALFGGKAWWMLAASNNEGRKKFASYGLFWEAIKFSKTENTTLYNLMGIDPYKNQGVYFFKKGTGAEFCEYLGEWSWSNSKALSFLVNLYLLKKQ